MKALVLLISIISSLSHPFAFESFVKTIPKGFSSIIKRNKLIITRDSSVKIQYFNYGMESSPKVLEHQYSITIEYSKMLTDKEIYLRQRTQDSTLKVFQKKMESNPTKSNYSQYESFENNRQKDKSFRIPFYSDNKYSYYLIDNIPPGFHLIDLKAKNEIDLILTKLKNIK